eukprot:gene809-450_t
MYLQQKRIIGTLFVPLPPHPSYAVCVGEEDLAVGRVWEHSKCRSAEEDKRRERMKERKEMRRNTQEEQSPAAKRDEGGWVYAMLAGFGRSVPVFERGEEEGGIFMRFEAHLFYCFFSAPSSPNFLLSRLLDDDESGRTPLCSFRFPLLFSCSLRHHYFFFFFLLFENDALPFQENNNNNINKEDRTHSGLRVYHPPRQLLFLFSSSLARLFLLLLLLLLILLFVLILSSLYLLSPPPLHHIDQLQREGEREREILKRGKGSKKKKDTTKKLKKLHCTATNHSFVLLIYIFFLLFLETYSGIKDLPPHPSSFSPWTSFRYRWTTPSRPGAASCTGRRGRDRPPAALNSGADLTALTSTTTLPEAVRLCLQSYYHDLSWNVPFPEHHAAPLLYLPKAYQQMRWAPDCFGIMQSEVDAMSHGLLESIPLGYYPLKAEDVQKGLEAAQETEENITKLRQRRTASGQLEPVMWPADEVNPALQKEDVELLDTDIDKGLEQQREIPSITLLLQRPTYTEMGTDSSLEQRHASRVRLVMPEAVQRVLAAAPPASPTRSQPPPSLEAVGPPFTGDRTAHNDAAAPTTVPPGEDDQGVHPGDGPTTAHQLHAMKERTWPERVKSAFRIARTVDKEYVELLQAVAKHKLGLDPGNTSHVELTTTLWRAVWALPSAQQQREVWSRFCNFSYQYDGPTGDGGGASTATAAPPAMRSRRSRTAERLVASLRELHPPHYLKVWCPLAEQYTALLDAYATAGVEAAEVSSSGERSRERSSEAEGEALKSFLEARRKELRIGSEEIDPRGSTSNASQHPQPNRRGAVVQHLQLPQLPVGALLDRRSRRYFSRNQQPIHIYPVAIAPVYPDGYTEAAKRLREKQQQQQQKKKKRQAAVRTGLEEGEEGEEDEEDFDFLAETAQALDHVVLPGAAVPEHVSLLDGPHMLVNGSKFLCVDAASVRDLQGGSGSASRDLQKSADDDLPADGSTLLYHTHRGNNFEPLYTDEENTSSFLFHHFESPLYRQFQQMAAAGAAATRENRRRPGQGKAAEWDLVPATAENTDHPVLGEALQRCRAEAAGASRSPNNSTALLGGSQSPAASQQQPAPLSMEERVRAVVRDAAGRGAVGLDGSVLIYNRIGARDYFRKAAVAQQAEKEVYGFIFSGEDERDAVAMAPAPPRKRPAHEAAAGTEELLGSRVKVEVQ